MKFTRKPNFRNGGVLEQVVFIRWTNENGSTRNIKQRAKLPKHDKPIKLNLIINLYD